MPCVPPTTTSDGNVSRGEGEGGEGGDRRAGAGIHSAGAKAPPRLCAGPSVARAAVARRRPLPRGGAAAAPVAGTAGAARPGFHGPPLRWVSLVSACASWAASEGWCREAPGGGREGLLRRLSRGYTSLAPSSATRLRPPRPSSPRRPPMPSFGRRRTRVGGGGAAIKPGWQSQTASSVLFPSGRPAPPHVPLSPHSPPRFHAARPLPPPPQPLRGAC